MTPSNQHLERETLLFYHLSPIYIHQKSQDLPGSNVQFLRLVHPLNPSVLWFYGSLGVLVSNNTNVKNKASKKHQNKNNYRFRPNHGPHPVPPASALAPYLNNKRAPESDFLCCCWDHRTVSQRNQIWLYIISTLYVYIYINTHYLIASPKKMRESIGILYWKVIGSWELAALELLEACHDHPSLSPASVIVTSCVVTMVIKMGPSFNPTRILLWIYFAPLGWRSKFTLSESCACGWTCHPSCSKGSLLTGQDPRILMYGLWINDIGKAYVPG